MSAEFKIGDRVRIKASEAFGFTQPCRGWAEKGRIGTVYGVSHDGRDSPVHVRFDTKRPPKRLADYQGSFRIKYLEHVSEPRP